MVTIRVIGKPAGEQGQAEINDLALVPELNSTYMIEIESANGTESYKTSLEDIRDLFNSGFIGLEQDASDLNYYYFGGLTSAGAWKVNRFAKSDLEKTSATISNNVGVTTLAAAWAIKGSLNYA
jgi:hypothetical protein